MDVNSQLLILTRFKLAVLGLENKRQKLKYHSQSNE